MGISKDNKVHVANRSSYDVRVIVVPNKDWVIADIVTALATTVVTAIATGGTSLGTVPAQIKTFSDLWELVTLLKTLGTMGSVLYKDGVLLELFEKATIKISPGEFKNVLEKVLYNPLDYLGPSGWAAISGASDVTLGVFLWNKASDVVVKTTQFNTNSDYSWLVDDAGVHRVKYGHIWVLQEGGTTHHWGG